MSVSKLSSIPIAAVLLALGLFCGYSAARGGRASDGPARPIILWVQEVRGQALYWVNDKACGRAPLSGIVVASGSDRAAELIVIVDSRVPIHELGEIEGLVSKIDPKDAHYYVFDRAYPGAGMSEIVWKTESLPLPAPPPK